MAPNLKSKLKKILLIMAGGAFYYGMIVHGRILDVSETGSFREKLALYNKQKERGTPHKVRSFNCGLPVVQGQKQALVHEGATMLRFPKGEDVWDVYRLNDIKDDCYPDRFKVRLFWYQGQLVNSDEFDQLGALPGAPKVANPNWLTVYLYFNRLDRPADVYDQTMHEMNSFDDPKRYQTSLPHRFLPLDYHPDFNYDNKEKWNKTMYTIRGSKSGKTGLPVYVFCIMDLPTTHNLTEIEKALSSTIVPLGYWGGSRCQGWDLVKKKQHLLGFKFEIYPDIVPEIDKIHAAILHRVENYIVD